jgi:hypothetical protein
MHFAVRPVNLMPSIVIGIYSFIKYLFCAFLCGVFFITFHIQWMASLAGLTYISGIPEQLWDTTRPIREIQ